MHLGAHLGTYLEMYLGMHFEMYLGMHLGTHLGTYLGMHLRMHERTYLGSRSGRYKKSPGRRGEEAGCRHKNGQEQVYSQHCKLQCLVI